MNGVRTTFMRRGYLLTALSALLLLAASAGTASAQITVDVPKTVNEGDNATVTVNVSGYIQSGVAGEEITVMLNVGEATDADAIAAAGATAGDTGEWNDSLAPDVTIPAAVAPQSGSRRVTASRSFVVQTLHDPDAENEALTFTVNVSGGGGLVDAPGGNAQPIGVVFNGKPGIIGDNRDMVIVDDDETQDYKLTLVTPNPTEEVGPIQVTLTADPAHDDGNSGPLTLDIPGPTNPEPSAATITGPEGGGTDSVTIEFTYGNDKNRVDDTITLTAYSGNAVSSGVAASLPITIKDDDVLPPVDAVLTDKDGKHLDPQPDSVNEGEDIYFVVRSLNPDPKVSTPLAPNEKLTIGLNPTGSADSADYQLVSAITIEAPGSQSGVVTLKVRGDDQDVGDETLVIDAIVSGVAANGSETSTSAGVLDLTITDATAKKIWTKSQDDAYPKITEAIEMGAGDEGLNPGESFMINTSDLFGYAEGYTASFSAASDSEAVSVSASGSTVTAMAESAGSAKVTITGTATMASSSFAPSQTVSNVASVTFEVTVVDKMLMLTLDAPGAMEGNVVEGMDYDVTVTANRAVHDDTEVMFMRSDMSEADVRDYSIEGVTIMAGEMMATATLMVTEDMEDDAGHAMGEALHLYAMAGDAKSNTLELTIWDEAVPALPLIGQLLLALFLMAGGARLYRRRQG